MIMQVKLCIRKVAFIISVPVKIPLDTQISLHLVLSCTLLSLSSFGYLRADDDYGLLFGAFKQIIQRLQLAE